MSQDKAKDATNPSKTKSLMISGGKYGGIITIALIACQILSQIGFSP